MLTLHNKETEGEVDNVHMCACRNVHSHMCMYVGTCVCSVVPKGYLLVEHCQVPWRISAYFAFTFAEDKNRTELVNCELQ